MKKIKAFLIEEYRAHVAFFKNPTWQGQVWFLSAVLYTMSIIQIILTKNIHLP